MLVLWSFLLAMWILNTVIFAKIIDGLEDWWLWICVFISGAMVAVSVNMIIVGWLEVLA